MSFVGEEFSPLPALVGGVILGISSTAYLLFTGRITGMSGFLEGIVLLNKASLHWQSVYVGTMILVGALAFSYYPSCILPPHQDGMALSWLGYAVGGFLVGLGTRLGSGCTSGHGVCGLPRLSLRSLTAVLCFMIAGVTTGTVLQANGFLLTDSQPDGVDGHYAFLRYAFVLVGLCLVGLGATMRGFAAHLPDTAITTVCAALFAVGLMVSGMVLQSKVWGFLALLQGWDPSLMFVMGGAVGLNLFTFQTILRNRQGPFFCFPGEECPRFKVPENNTRLDWELVYGSLLFGMGWGISGTCPGPMIVQLGVGYPKIVLAYLPGLALGVFAARWLKSAVAAAGKQRETKVGTAASAHTAKAD